MTTYATQLPQFGDAYDGAQMRALVQKLEAAFAKIVVAEETAVGLFSTSLPQDLQKGASPTFLALSLTNFAASGLFKLSGVETGLTAHVGGTQATALALSTTLAVHNISTVGSAADSVKLPSATGSGAVHWVKNSAATNSLQLFGSGTDTIDLVATATGVAVAAGRSRICLDYASGLWLSIYGS